MQLKTKTLLIIFLVMGIFSFSLFLYYSVTLKNGFLFIEKNSTVAATKQVLFALQKLQSDLLVKQSDWAHWDDSYQFIQDGNQEFIDSNLNNASFVNLKIELMIFLNAKNEVIYKKSVNLDSGKEITMTSEQELLFGKESPLLGHQNILDRKSGLFLFKEGLFLVGAQQILTSLNEGPSQGTLIWGYFLSDEVQSEVMATTHLDFELHLHHQGFDDEGGLFKELADTTYQIAVEPKGQNQIIGHALMKDILGQANMHLKVLLQRPIYLQGQKAIRSIAQGQLMVMILFLVLFYLLLHKLILNPISKVDADLHRMTHAPDFAGEVSIYSQDELGHLAQNINKLVTVLRDKISETKSFARRIKDHEAKLGKIIDNALDTVVTISQNGEVIDWNHQAEVLFGYTQAEAFSVDIAKLIIPYGQRIFARNILVHFLKTGQQNFFYKRLELTGLHKSGNEIPIEVAISPIKFSNYYLFNAFIRDLRPKTAH